MFEWDEAKAAENISNHGVDFVRAARMFDYPVLEREDARQFWGERRVMAIGQVDGFHMVVCWTPRGTRKRIISAWRADRDDEAIYHAAVPQAALAAAGLQPARRALPAILRGGVLEFGRPRLSLPKPPAGAAKTGS